MPDPFYQIFKKPSDHNNWDKQVEFYSKSPEITDDRRAKILEALNYLKKHLPNGFLKSTKTNHPVKYGIANKAIHSIDWLIWLSESLSALEHDQENFDILLSKLVPVEDSIREGVPFLEIANPLQKNGFKVEFEPEVQGFKCDPDIRLTNLKNQEIIYVEVSTTNESKEGKFVMSNYLYLNSIMEGRSVYFSGKIYENLSIKELVKLETQIDTLIKNCVDYDRLEVLTLSETGGKLELAIACKVDSTELKDWIKSKNLRLNEVQSKDISFREDIRRINNYKIHKKAKQIPPDNLGFIYLKVNPLIFLTLNLKESIFELNRRLVNYENIVGLVLWSDVGGKCEPFGLKLGANFYHEFPIFEINKRMTLFVFNEACKLRISVNSLHKILASMETN